ncbi:MAG TPA: hypothetical protein VOB72_05920 [Candidatus Dormibacteraeota bacterium]|nr:hypothetical protein [Candidatus Dormibacteraeota bacterium]
MRTADRTQVVAWSLLGVLVGTAALAVVASAVSSALALAVALGGAVATLVLAWAAQPAGESRDLAAEPPHEEQRPAA